MELTVELYHFHYTSLLSFYDNYPINFFFLIEFFLRILVDKKETQLTEHTINDDDTDVVVKIKELLDSKVRPAVAMDGGDIVFDKYDEGIVFLRMQGSCAGCPSSTATLKMGIENMLKHYIPEVREVRPVEA